MVTEINVQNVSELRCFSGSKNKHNPADFKQMQVINSGLSTKSLLVPTLTAQCSGKT
jgi:hypothetical protein